MWDQSDSLAECEAFCVMAGARTPQQEFRRQGAVVEDAAHQQSGCVLVTPRRRHSGAYRYRAGRVLPSPIGRVGKAKAITATAGKIAVLFYNTLRHGMIYADPGATYDEDRYKQRVLANLQRRAKSLGFVLRETDEGAAQMGVA